MKLLLDANKKINQTGEMGFICLRVDVGGATPSKKALRMHKTIDTPGYMGEHRRF